MMTREDLALAIHAFMGELSAHAAIETRSKLQRFPELVSHMDEVLASLRESNSSEQELLMAAFGLVDHYVEARWDTLIEDTYRFRTDQLGSVGDARRDPEA